MTRIVFWLTLLSWGYLFVHFVRRYVIRRKLPSIVIAVACTGWPVAIARELRLLPRDLGATPLIAAGFACGVVGAFIVLSFESQR